MPDVIMQYDMMRKMTSTFNDSAERLEQDLKMLKAISTLVEGGVLTGGPGHKLIDYIDQTLIPETDLLQKKLQELASDVEGARAYMEDGDDSAASRFK